MPTDFCYNDYPTIDNQFIYFFYSGVLFWGNEWYSHGSGERRDSALYLHLEYHTPTNEHNRNRPQSRYLFHPNPGCPKLPEHHNYYHSSACCINTQFID
jgi:hypothetical protein